MQGEERFPFPSEHCCCFCWLWGRQVSGLTAMPPLECYCCGAGGGRGPLQPGVGTGSCWGTCRELSKCYTYTGPIFQKHWKRISATEGHVCFLLLFHQVRLLLHYILKKRFSNALCSQIKLTVFKLQSGCPGCLGVVCTQNDESGSCLANVFSLFIVTVKRKWKMLLWSTLFSQCSRVISYWMSGENPKQKPPSFNKLDWFLGLAFPKFQKDSFQHYDRIISEHLFIISFLLQLSLLQHITFFVSRPLLGIGHGHPHYVILKKAKRWAKQFLSLLKLPGTCPTFWPLCLFFFYGSVMAETSGMCL